jgi:hypothetical protein
VALSDRAKRIIVALSFLGAGIVGTYLFLKLATARADDENPIRVRNKILNFESESPQGEWAADGGTRWRLKKNKHVSDVFEVNAFGSSDCVASLFGVSVQITFQLDSGDTRTFTITTADEPGQNPKKEPVVDVGASQMSSDNGGYKKKLRLASDPSGHITQMIVQQQTGGPVTCTFPAEPRVLIELCRGRCS